MSNKINNIDGYAIWIDIAPEEIANSAALRRFMRQHAAYWEPRLSAGHLAYWFWEGDESPEEPWKVSNAEIFESEEAAVRAICDMGEEWKRAAMIVPINFRLGRGLPYYDIVKRDSE